MLRHALLVFVLAGFVLATPALASDADRDPAADPSIVASDEDPTPGPSGVDTDGTQATVVQGSGACENRWGIAFSLGLHVTSFYDRGELQRDFGMYGSIGCERVISDRLHGHIRVKGLATDEAQDVVSLATGGVTFRGKETFPSNVLMCSAGVAHWQRMHYDDEWGPAIIVGFGVRPNASKQTLLMVEFAWAEPRHDWSIGLAGRFVIPSLCATPN